MLGRIYTFERRSARRADTAEHVAYDALGAITLAGNGLRGIRFETLTDFDNPRPLIVVLFEARESVRRFDAKLQRLLQPLGIDVDVMGTALGTSEASDPGLDALPHAA